MAQKCFKYWGPVSEPETHKRKMDSKIAKALSGDEVNRAAGGGVKIIRYPDLASVSTWADLCSSEAQAAAVLFCVESPTSGHWLAAFTSADGAHVFDPIGVALDAERTYISKGQQALLGETQPQFARLLDTFDGPTHVSKTDYQRNAPGVNTCGRWVALRIKNKNLTDAQFARWVSGSARKAGLDDDSWVVSVSG